MIDNLPDPALTLIIYHIGGLPKDLDSFKTDRKDLLNLLLTSKKVNDEFSKKKDWLIFHLLFSSFYKSISYIYSPNLYHEVLYMNLIKFAQKKKNITLEILIKNLFGKEYHNTLLGMRST